MTEEFDLSMTNEDRPLRSSALRVTQTAYPSEHVMNPATDYFPITMELWHKLALKGNLGFV